MQNTELYQNKLYLLKYIILTLRRNVAYIIIYFIYISNYSGIIKKKYFLNKNKASEQNRSNGKKHVLLMIINIAVYDNQGQQISNNRQTSQRQQRIVKRTKTSILFLQDFMLKKINILLLFFILGTCWSYREEHCIDKDGDQRHHNNLH